ncbi:unnamed protein product [Phytomonas sp. EM1]|nr:unnamed protein product [Phytomonas sp. EM1]|eukprot:CCW64246.1 unnamed protein product [Phytomonas sp. isolate EM1]
MTTSAGEGGGGAPPSSPSPIFPISASSSPATSGFASAFKLRQRPDPQWCRPLEEILGIYTGGPRGCRAGQPGHDPAVYQKFLDFIRRLLEYDPRRRMNCAEAIRHPFIAPLIEMEAKAAAAAAQYL